VNGSPFIDPLPIPQALAPGWRADPTLPYPQEAWTCRWSRYKVSPDNPTGEGVSVPGPAEHQQDAYGHCYSGDTIKNYEDESQMVAVEHDGTHQVWPNSNGQNSDRLVGSVHGPFPDPILYHIRLQVSTHRFTSSPVEVMVDVKDTSGNVI